MKLALFVEDEAWFWIWNDETQLWEGWYESDISIASLRLTKMDRPSVLDVTDLMNEMVRTYEWEEINNVDASLNK